MFDVAVDLRKGSPTFGKWHGELLTEENKKQFFIPKGFAHGFYVTGEFAAFTYKCTVFYHPEDEAGIAWDDAEIGIKWPVPQGEAPLLSDKDRQWPSFAAYREAHP